MARRQVAAARAFGPDDGISDEDYLASVAADRPLTATHEDNRAPANGGK